MYFCPNLFNFYFSNEHSIRPLRIAFMSLCPSDHTTVCRMDYHRLVSVLLSLGTTLIVDEESGRAGRRPGRISCTICQWKTYCKDREAAKTDGCPQTVFSHMAYMPTLQLALSIIIINVGTHLVATEHLCVMYKSLFVLHIPSF